MCFKAKVAAWVAVAAVLTMSSPAFACEGVFTQESDCMRYYGPVDQSPYKGTVPKPGQTSAGEVKQGARNAARAPR